MKANAIGVSWNDFWHMNPHIVGLLVDGHNEKIKEIDTLAWSFGNYLMSAFDTVLSNNFSKHSTAKYMKEPMLKEVERQNTPLTEEELQKQRELFVAKLETMKTDFDLNHPKKESAGQ